MVLLSLFCTSPLALAASIQSIITLSPSAAELVYSAGLGDKLIAVSEGSDYPEEVRKLETVANHQGINVERVIQLDPDLIITDKNSGASRELEQIKKFGFTVHEVNIKSLDDIPDQVQQLIQYAEDPTIGLHNLERFENRVSKLSRTFEEDEYIPFFYQLNSIPLITVSDDHWPNDVFTFCGGKNIFSDSPVPYPQVNMEQIVVRQPDFIFISSNSSTSNSIWNDWRAFFPSLSENSISLINADWLDRPTMRTLDAVEDVCRHLDAIRN